MRLTATAVLIMFICLGLGMMFVNGASGQTLRAFMAQAPSAPDTPAWQSPWAGLLIVIAGAVGTWLINFMKTRADIKTKSDADAVDQYRGIVTSLREEVTGLVVARDECLRMHTEARVKIAELEGTVRLVTADLRRLQAVAGDEHPPVTLPVVLVGTQDGMVQWASPQVAALLHWLPDTSEEAGRDVVTRTAPFFVQRLPG
jgi:membrane protein implicated in regulation of membrane protease activity